MLLMVANDVSAGICRSIYRHEKANNGINEKLG